MGVVEHHQHRTDRERLGQDRADRSPDLRRRRSLLRGPPLQSLDERVDARETGELRRPGAQDLEPGEVGAPGVGLAAAGLEHRGAGRAASRVLEHQARLSDSGLAPKLDELDSLPRPGDLLELVELALPPDEASQPAGPLDREAFLVCPRPEQLEDLHRLGQTPDPLLPQRREAEEVAAAARRLVADQDLSGGRRRLESGGDSHRGSLRRVVPAKIGSDRADPDVAAVYPHPQHQREAEPRAHRFSVGLGAGPDLQGRAQRARCALLQSLGRPEERHEPIAPELVDGSPLGVHRLEGECEEAVHHGVHALGVEGSRHGERARHVGDQDGHLLALALTGLAPGQYLAGEVLGGVGRRPGLRGGAGIAPCELGAAREAVAAPDRQVLFAATGTPLAQGDSSQRLPTARAGGVDPAGS